MTNAIIKAAVGAWCANSADAQYGLISKWDTSRVTDTQGLFSQCACLYYSSDSSRGCRELDLSSWNVSSVTAMDNMFYGAWYFN